MHRLQPLLEDALGEKLALPKRKLTRLEAFPDVERVILDGTGRPIQRAKDRDQQLEDYSGQKKRHTRTHLVAVAHEQKAENQALARERVVGEHAFVGLKRYGIATQVHRNRKQNFDDRSIFTRQDSETFI